MPTSDGCNAFINCKINRIEEFHTKAIDVESIAVLERMYQHTIKKIL